MSTSGPSSAEVNLLVRDRIAPVERSRVLLGCTYLKDKRKIPVLVAHGRNEFQSENGLSLLTVNAMVTAEPVTVDFAPSSDLQTFFAVGSAPELPTVVIGEHDEESTRASYDPKTLKSLAYFDLVTSSIQYGRHFATLAQGGVLPSEISSLVLPPIEAGLGVQDTVLHMMLGARSVLQAYTQGPALPPAS